MPVAAPSLRCAWPVAKQFTNFGARTGHARQNRFAQTKGKTNAAPLAAAPPGGRPREPPRQSIGFAQGQALPKTFRPSKRPVIEAARAPLPRGGVIPRGGPTSGKRHSCRFTPKKRAKTFFNFFSKPPCAVRQDVIHLRRSKTRLGTRKASDGSRTPDKPRVRLRKQELWREEVTRRF